MEQKIRLVNWNLEWAKITNKRGRLIRQIIVDAQPDIICLTEASSEMLSDRGRTITAQADYGYPIKKNRRKVLLWSRQPWTEIDSFGDANLPGGRFVTGITYGIRFIGVCIPWRFAHVNTGRRDRRPWEDHVQYLTTFGALLTEFTAQGIPICVVGDFNQQIPRSRQPANMLERLNDAFGDGFTFATANIRDEENKLLIDHVAVSHDTSAEVERIIPRHSPEGTRLTYHAGVVVVLS